MPAGQHAACACSIFERLPGMWSFRRDIPGHAHAEGHAAIRLIEPGRALYDESARITLVTGATLQGRQRYWYRQTKRADGLDVLFHESGELFHSLAFRREPGGSLRAEAAHVCGADLYVSDYELTAEGRLRVRHAVRGPRKDYTITTSYNRVPSVGEQGGEEGIEEPLRRIDSADRL